MKLVIIIPCYNEEKKMNIEAYSSFLSKHSDISICFVNDGSSDNTLKIVETIQENFTDQVIIRTYSKNRGKAEAVREGMLYTLNSNHFTHFGMFDADLATPLEECLRLAHMVNDNKTFVFGSRILKIGNNIKRKFYRFIIGRFIATMISKSLRLAIYDTQCGCKIFAEEEINTLFENNFISKWLFDVELFFRMITKYGKKEVVNKMLEVPLTSWEDMGDSKVKWTYSFKLFFDLIKINKKYR